MKITPKSTGIIFHKEINESPYKKDSILIAQNFFDPVDRYEYKDNERVEKYVKEFEKNKVYACSVVVTNISPATRDLDVLVQIPVGALPINSFFTKSRYMALKAYSTISLDYQFYFPFTGDFAHFPAHASEKEEGEILGFIFDIHVLLVVAFAEPVTLHVVDEPSNIDVTSWDFVSQKGDDKQLLKFLKEENIHRNTIDLNRY